MEEGQQAQPLERDHVSIVVGACVKRAANLQRLANGSGRDEFSRKALLLERRGCQGRSRFFDAGEEVSQLSEARDRGEHLREDAAVICEAERVEGLNAMLGNP